MFHAHDGWLFIGHDDGSVTIEKRESAQEDATMLVIGNFSADEWASIVASVSKRGEADRRWYTALEFHTA